MDSAQASYVNIAPLGPLPASPPAVQDFVGCQTCRELHIGCDRALPICGPCHRRGRKCRRTGLKVRLAKGKGFSFAKAKWVKIPKRISFQDETSEVIREAQNEGRESQQENECPSPVSVYTIDSETGQSPTPRASLLDDDPYGEPAEPLPSLRSHEHQSLATHGPSPQLLLHQHTSASQPPEDTPHSTPKESAVYSPSIPCSPTDRFIIQDTHLRDFDSQDLNSQDPSIELHIERSASPDRPVWPLESEDEAMLYNHYVHSLANWLDLCDPRRLFETLVPQRAGTCRMLLNAILAFAGWHKTNTKAGDYYELANRCHKDCIEGVIHLISKGSEAEENIFAATIILRVVEEIRVPDFGIDHKSYLSAFAKSLRGGRYIVPGSLSAACFWVNLRQQIYTAVMHRHPVDLDLVPSLVDRSLSDADEYTWANRAVVHCADVLNFCFETPQPLSSSSWDELDAWNRMWQKKLPASCHPVFFQEWGETPGKFPRVCYRSSCHVIGAQHHILAALLLLRHDPNVPEAGSMRRMVEARRDRRVRQLVREVCGIGLDNQWTAPAMFTACMSISQFGDSFRDSRDQKAMLTILERTERDHARPTKAVRHQMMALWGWPPPDGQPPDGTLSPPPMPPPPEAHAVEGPLGPPGHGTVVR